MRPLLAAILAALSLLALLPASARRRPRAPRESRISPGALPVMAAALLALSVIVVVGGLLGIALGAGSAALAWWVLGWFQGASARARLVALGRQAAPACDLLAAVLASGAEPTSAIAAVADSMGDPLGAELRLVAARLRLGATMREAWTPIAAIPALEPLVAALVRSSESGAPLVESLRRAARDQRLRDRAELITQARVLGVRSVLPLGLCFLPAFVLLGIVPVVVSLVSGVLRLG